MDNLFMTVVLFVITSLLTFKANGGFLLFE